MLFRDKKKEISFTAGRLGKKIGVSGKTTKRKLKKTGLIDDCYRDENDWIQIPYSVAVQLASEEALAVEPKRSKSKKRKKKAKDLDLVEMGLMPPKTQDDYFPSKKSKSRKQAEEKLQAQMRDCRTLVCLLRKLGVTPKMA